MKRVNARDFESLQDFLRYQIERSLLGISGRKVSNLETIARQLGYKSPSILSMVLKGQRLPSDEMVQAMSDTWKLNSGDREFFSLLVQMERQKKKGRDSSRIQLKIGKLAKKKNAIVFSLDQFNLVRDWFHGVIRELITTPGFVEDPLWISRRLRKKITPAQAKKAIELLLNVGVVRRDAESGKIIPNSERTETSNDIPSEAIRTYHRGMIDRALEALEEQPVENRFFNSMTLKVAPEKLPLAKKRIVDFIMSFEKEFETTQTDHIYQLNVQMFEHTREDGAVLRSGSNETH